MGKQVPGNFWVIWVNFESILNKKRQIWVNFDQLQDQFGQNFEKFWQILKKFSQKRVFS